MFSRAVRRPSACRLATASGRLRVGEQRFARAQLEQVGAERAGAGAGGAAAAARPPRRRAWPPRRSEQRSRPRPRRRRRRPRTDATTPSPSARTSCSIFIDSTIARPRRRRATLRPGSTASATTLPARGERSPWRHHARRRSSHRAHRAADSGRSSGRRGRCPRHPARDHVGHHARGAGRHGPAERAVAGGEEQVGDRRRRRSPACRPASSAAGRTRTRPARCRRRAGTGRRRRASSVSPARVVQLQGVAGELGRAADADAVAEARHRDLVRLVHHGRLGRAGRRR